MSVFSTAPHHFIEKTKLKKDCILPRQLHEHVINLARNLVPGLVKSFLPFAFGQDEDERCKFASFSTVFKEHLNYGKIDINKDVFPSMDQMQLGEMHS